MRAVCYRLFTEGLINSMSKSNTNKVSRLLTLEREEGTVPWEWIVDETREAERTASWRDVAEFGDGVKRSYRRDYWTMQPRWIEVWSEKGTVRGTLAPVLHKFGVTFRVMHGHGSATAIHQAGRGDPREPEDADGALHRRPRSERPAYVRRGSARTARALRRNFSAHDKVNDLRYGWFVENFGERCHEIDALNPVILRRRIEAEILGRLDVDRAEIDSMNMVMKTWPSISGHATK